MISVRRILVACALFTLLAAGSAAPEDAATVVPGGALDKDAAWSGTVLVERETRVGRGATLAVKPGAVVLFRKGAGLVVEGELVAEGEAGAPIRFASAEKEAAPGDWTGISFIGARDGSVLSRCSVLDAAAINVEGCSPAIRRCEIGRGRTGIIVARKAAPSISGNLVRGMADGGIRCERESAPRIEANEITECGPFGILAGQDAAPAVRKNRVTGCERGLAFSGTIPPVEGNEWRNNKVGVVAGSAGTSQAIRGNRFAGNRTGLLCEQFSNLLVEGNEFRENGDAIVCFRSSSPVIRNNAIANNEQGILGTQLSNPKIEGNEISGNRKGIFLTLSSYAVVHGNNIHGNDVQMELGNMSHDWEVRVGKKPERGAQARLSVRMSRGLAGPREIAESQERGDGAEVMGFVDATGNWWGEEDTKEMEAKGPDANIGRLVDYHDVPTRTYEGYEGVYVQDKIRYEGWKKERIAGAGINAADGGAGK